MTELISATLRLTGRTSALAICIAVIGGACPRVQGGGENDATRLFPPDAIAALRWETGVDATRGAADAWRATLGWLASVAGQASDEDAALLRLAADCAGRPAGVALLDVRVEDGRVAPIAVLAVRAGSECAQLETALAAVMRGAQPAARIAESSDDGVRLRSTPIGDSPLVLAWASRGGWFVAATRVEALRDVLGRIDASKPSLAESEPRRAMRSAAPAGEASFGVSMNGPRAVAALREVAVAAGLCARARADELIAAFGLDGVRGIESLAADDGEGRPQRRTHLAIDRFKGLLALWEQKPLSLDDLRIIPADASWAQVCNLDLPRCWEAAVTVVRGVDDEASLSLEALIEMTGSALGISLTHGVFPALGDTWALFDSPSHGGVLGTGTVLVVETRDAALIDEWLRRVVGVCAPVAANHGMTLAVRETNMTGRSIRCVTFGGAPVPLSPAWGFADGRLVLGFFPQTVAAALEQVDPATRGPSILDHPDWPAAAKALPADPISFGYTNARQMGEAYYPLVLLYETAIVSQYGAAPRAETLPPLRAALRGARDSFGACARENGGVVYAGVGSSLTGLTVAAAGLGATWLAPALGRVRQTARGIASEENLAQIAAGLAQFAALHDGRFPTTLRELASAGVVAGAALRSPVQPANPEAYTYISGQTWRDDARNVLVYETPVDERGTRVLLLDGSVEHVSLAQLAAQVRETYRRLKRETEIPPRFRSVDAAPAGK